MNAIILQAGAGMPKILIIIIILILVITVTVFFIKNKKFKEIIKTALIPKKLWVLRFYERFLTFIVELTLVSYILVSIYNLIKNDYFLGDLILGYAGFYVVSVCLAILFVTQVVSLFLNIHDNIEDVRNKNIDPNFSIDIEADKENKQESSVRTLVTIISIVLAIILSFVNLNRQNKLEETTIIQKNEINKYHDERYNVALDILFRDWSFINHFKSHENIKTRLVNGNGYNEVCDESYCVSFTEIDNWLIISYSSKETVEFGTKIYNLLTKNKDVWFGKFYVKGSDVVYKNKLYISEQGYNDVGGRFNREGTFDLNTFSRNWEGEGNSTPAAH
jgi:hypothetical protein